MTAQNAYFTIAGTGADIIAAGDNFIWNTSFLNDPSITYDGLGNVTVANAGVYLVSWGYNMDRRSSMSALYINGSTAQNYRLGLVYDATIPGEREQYGQITVITTPQPAMTVFSIRNEVGFGTAMQLTNSGQSPQAQVAHLAIVRLS